MGKMIRRTLVLALVFVALFATATLATVPHELNVDGVTYAPSKLSGPTVHYETPDVNPTSAFSERHVWEGNGSENLPCEGGIHWIDNKNVLTISNCLEIPESTTTTTVVVTTTTVPPTTTTVPPTTTTIPETTTTTVQTTTTTTPSTTTSTTTVPESTTTTVVVTTTTVPPCVYPDCLPETGRNLALPFFAGLALMALGLAALTVTRARSG